MDNLQEELARLKEEIRDLKTAQMLPGYSRMYRGTLSIPAGNYQGVYAWTITFEQDGFGNAPIIHFDQGRNMTLLGFDFINNTQQIEFFANPYGTSIAETRYFYSTRPIASVGPLAKTHNIDDYTPPPTWQQVRSFSLSRMGTTPGYCLMNCRLGFGINSGTYASAIADKNAQAANGTLHDARSAPPSELQVPVYINTGDPNGHVVVWDRGTVYSDGQRITNGLNYYGLANVWGWGEFCDGVRVVQQS